MYKFKDSLREIQANVLTFCLLCADILIFGGKGNIIVG